MLLRTRSCILRIKKLPETLIYLSLRVPKIFRLNNLGKIKYLKLTGYGNTLILENLPNSLTHLWIDGLHINNFAGLPSSLIKLNLLTIPMDNVIKNLPSSLESLSLHVGKYVETYKLEDLGNIKLVSLGNVEKLKIFGHIVKMENFPATLKTLITDRMNEIPVTLPSSLTRLKITFCNTITKLENLPKGLSYLRIDGYNNITKLENLPYWW